MNRGDTVNINRDYLIKLSLAKAGASRGKILASNIVFYTSDRYTQNIFLVADTDITDIDKIELLFAIDGNNFSVIGTLLDSKTVLFDLDYQQLQEAGTYRAVISLHMGADILTSDLFKFRVEASVLGGGNNGW